MIKSTGAFNFAVRSSISGFVTCIFRRPTRSNKVGARSNHLIPGQLYNTLRLGRLTDRQSLLRRGDKTSSVIIRETGNMSDSNSNNSNSNGHSSNGEATLKAKFKPRELRFKNPFGHIAAMEWGNTSAPYKILCVHGWLDNAGSFERIVPYILDHKDNSERYHIVAIDMPGVGLSSHKPPGAEYSNFSTVIEMRRVAQQLKWDKMILLSHSLGAHVSFLYSCIYPTQVHSLISIDLSHPMTRHAHNWNIDIAQSVDEHFKCEYHSEDDPTTNIRIPVYSETDAVKRLMEGHSSSLNEEAARVMLKRGAKRQRWGYTFRRDMRLRYLSIEFRPDDELMLQYLQGPFRPNLFVITASRSPYRRPEELRKRYFELFNKNCPIFKWTTLDGTHHLHMNTPETVAPEICQFLDEVTGSRPPPQQILPDRSNL